MARNIAKTRGKAFEKMFASTLQAEQEARTRRDREQQAIDVVVAEMSNGNYSPAAIESLLRRQLASGNETLPLVKMYRANAARLS